MFNNVCVIILNFAYISTTNAIVASSINIIGSIEQTSATSCIKNVIKSSFGTGFLTLSSTSNLSISATNIEREINKWVHIQNIWSMQVIGGLKSELDENYVGVPENHPVVNKNNRHPLSNFYIIITDSIDNFVLKTKNLIHSKSFNSKAKFIIYMSYMDIDFKNKAEKILKYLWKNYILNAVVIIPQNSYFYHNIYTLYPISSSETCVQRTEMLRLEKCHYGSRLEKYSLFPNKLRLNVNNCSIEVLAIESPPFVINVKNNTGFEIKLLKLIGEKLNISFRYTVQNKTEYWLKRNNESVWLGAQKYMKEIGAIGIGNMIANGDIYEDFQVTNTYHFEYLRWIVPKAEPAPRWKCLIVIFNEKLWIACISVFVSSGLLFFVLSYINNEIKSYKSFSFSFLISLQILIGNALFKQPKTQIIRFVFFLTALYGIIVCCLYQSALINVLTNPLFETQISTQEQILKSGLRIGGSPTYKFIFDNSATKDIYDIFETNTSFASRNAYDWLVRVASVKDTCTVSNLFYVMYVQSSAEKKITNQKGYNQLFITKKNLMSYPVHMVASRSFPFFEEFNKAIFQITTGGLTIKWLEEVKHLINLKIKEQPKSGVDDDIKLTIDHVQGAFMVFIFGNFVAVLIFICEIMVYNTTQSSYYKKMCLHVKFWKRNKKVVPHIIKNKIGNK